MALDINDFLIEMGYTEADSERCKNCKFFFENVVYGDSFRFSGLPLSTECRLNPVLSLPVEPDGLCRFFSEK